MSESDSDIGAVGSGLGLGKERLNSTSVRCILLDLGKVLLDFDFKRFGDRMRALTGVDAESLQEVYTGTELARKYESGLLRDEEFYSEVCRRIGKPVDWEDFVAAWNSIFCLSPIVPDDLVRVLSERCNLWIVSNTNAIHFNYIEMNFAILRHFKGFVLSHQVGALKPDPKIFIAALQRAGVAPENALFVDDQLPNVEAARKLGMDAFQFLGPEPFALECRRRRIL